MFGAAYVTMMPAVARDLIHGDSTTQGTLMSAAGAGALIGAYLLSRITESSSSMRLCWPASVSGSA